MLTERSRELIRWAVKSGIGLGVNLALLTVWVDSFGVPPQVAIFINGGLLSVYGYLVTMWWVFDDTKQIQSVRGHVKQFLGMQGILAGGKIVNYLIYVALIWAGIDYRVSWVLGALVGLVISFGGNRTWWTGVSQTRM